MPAVWHRQVAAQAAPAPAALAPAPVLAYGLVPSEEELKKRCEDVAQVLQNLEQQAAVQQQKQFAETLMANISRSSRDPQALAAADVVLQDAAKLQALGLVRDANGFTALHCVARQVNLDFVDKLCLACPATAEAVSLKEPDGWLQIHCLADNVKVK